MTPFSVSQELRVGKIVEVAGDSIRIEIDSDISELTRTHGGDIYPIGQCGSVIKLHAGRRVLFAYVRVLRMRSEIAYQEGLPAPTPAEDARLIEANLFAEGCWNSGKSCLELERGVTTYPLPGQGAYLTTLEELCALYGPDNSRERPQHRMEIGSYVGAVDSICYADIDKLFGLHCAVLGSTGSGKSGTVAAILHSLLDAKKSDSANEKAFRPRVIVIDPHGEYANAFRGRCRIFRAYSLVSGECDSPDIMQLRLPYWLMSGEEFRDLVIAKTEWEATTENNVVLKALRHARLVSRTMIDKSRDNWAEVAVADSELPENDRPISQDKDILSRIASYDRDTPDPFTLEEFRNHIQYEQQMRRTSTSKTWQFMSPSDSKSHSSILDKLSVLERDPRLDFMMHEYQKGDPDLPEIIQQFVGELPANNSDTCDIRIVDISGLPNEVAGPLTAAIARLLFQYKIWQTRGERERDPVLLVFEEAHRYVPDTGLAEYASAQKAIRRLAKEGRKYGIGMMLVSQRPADVEGTVLSQCNSWLVLRLTNATDQSHVTRFLPDNLAGLARLLPSLSRQEAIFVGDAAPLPARIRIRSLEKAQLPKSDDISFGNGWQNPPVSLDEIQVVVNRWRRDGTLTSIEPQSQAAPAVATAAKKHK